MIFTPERQCERCKVTQRFGQTFLPTEGGYRVADICASCRRELEQLIDRFTTKRSATDDDEFGIAKLP